MEEAQMSIMDKAESLAKLRGLSCGACPICGRVLILNSIARVTISSDGDAGTYLVFEGEWGDKKVSARAEVFEFSAVEYRRKQLVDWLDDLSRFLNTLFDISSESVDIDDWLEWSYWGEGMEAALDRGELD